MIGTTLAHYRITAALGAGGMGEVWLATDTKLGREVALKVLPEAFASDPDRLARFEREAKVLASLNHPNIAHLYGLESVSGTEMVSQTVAGTGSGSGSDSSHKPQAPSLSSPPAAGTAAPQGPAVGHTSLVPDGADGKSEIRNPKSEMPAARPAAAGPVTFLVMELVEGEDLSERLKRGPIPVDEAMAIALQIAEALEAAHEQGIVHRDLKPANIKITDDGTVKVLDFGLAKAWEAEGTDLSSSFSPTITRHATLEGVILGTAAYMSPEQARGKKVDRRADIWAFGVVLWEMLTGRKLFDGDTVTDVLAAILTREPDLDSLPAATPPRIRALIGRCLHRDPKLRQRDMGDVRLELSGADDDPEGSKISYGARFRPVWALAALVGAVAGLLVGLMLYGTISSPNAVTGSVDRAVRRSILIPAPIGGPRDVLGIAVSPDGSAVVLGQGYGGEGLLELRRLASFESTLIPDTDGGVFPFFSPDGRWLAFFDDDELRKVPMDGGPSSVICDAAVTMGGTWSDDGWIYFTHGESRLARVPEDGGEPENLKLEGAFGPHALPGGRGVLVNHSSGSAASGRRDLAVISVVSADGSVKKVIDDGYAPRYVASGHLVFVRQGLLLAAPFDLERLEVTGSEVQVSESVSTDSVWGFAHYDVAADGTLVYLRGGDYAATVPTWIDREGVVDQPLSVERNVYGTFQLSPDGSKLAIQVAEESDQIHVYDFARETLTRVTFEGASRYPAWSHDGRELFYLAFRDGAATIMRRPVDGSGAEVPLLTSDDLERVGGGSLMPYDASPDGRYLLVGTWGDFETGADVWLIALDGSSEPQPLIRTPANEIIPSFSPDGNFMSYHSNKAGEYGIYVRPFPDVDGREWTISARGGYDARWSPSTNEILYRVGARRLMSVPYQLEPEFRPGTERLVMAFDAHDSAGFSFDLSGDGKRILVNRPAMSYTDERPMMLVSDWFVELEALAGKGGGK
jgi:serine/threonine-protein kinase